jgi:hypothetical protein
VIATKIEVPETLAPWGAKTSVLPANQANRGLWPEFWHPTPRGARMNNVLRNYI